MISNEDLLKEISQKELLELSDIDATGEINQDVIDDALSDALSFIGSFIIVPSEPSRLLRDIATDLTVLELKKRHNFPKKAMKEMKDRCESILLKMSSKKIPTTVARGGTVQAPIQRQRSFRHNKQ